MNFFEIYVKHFARYMYYIAGAAIVAMMLLSTIDVIMRAMVPLYTKYDWQIFSIFQPIPGTYELVSFLGSVAAAFAMAHTTVEAGHVGVNLIVRLLPHRIRLAIQFLTNGLGIVLFALITWRLIVYANELRLCDEVSMTLELPFYPFVYGVAFSACAVCLVLLVHIMIDIGKWK